MSDDRCVLVTPAMRRWALLDARRRAPATTKRHDFHAGSAEADDDRRLERVADKFTLGNLGVAAVRAMLRAWRVRAQLYAHDGDDFGIDLIVDGLGAIDVKTSAREPLLHVLAHSFPTRKADYYVLAHAPSDWADRERCSITILGWADRQTVRRAPVQASGEGLQTRRNYLVQPHELHSIYELVLRSRAALHAGRWLAERHVSTPLDRWTASARKTDRRRAPRAPAPPPLTAPPAEQGALFDETPTRSPHAPK